MTTNSQLLTTEPKTETKTNQANNQNGNKIIEMETTWKVISGGVGGERREKGTENKQHKWQVEDRQEEVKNSIGNAEAKMYMALGHELKGGMWVEGGTQGGRNEGKMGQL